MVFKKEHLDMRICDVEEGTVNTDTLRNFIITSEKEFDLIPKDLGEIDDNTLNEYVEFLDYLWTK